MLWVLIRSSSTNVFMEKFRKLSQNLIYHQILLNKSPKMSKIQRKYSEEFFKKKLTILK